MTKLILGIAAICAAVILLIFLVYIFLILPSQRRHEVLQRCLGRQFAHRGLHSKEKNIPENSLAAFKAAVDSGFGIELDVRLDADGNLFVMHDNNALRMTGVDMLISKSHYAVYFYTYSRLYLVPRYGWASLYIYHMCIYAKIMKNFF